MNFVTNLLSSKRKKIVYNSIFVIVNRCTKIIKYVFITIKLDVVKLTKMFFIEIVLHFNMFENIVNNRDFVFTNKF